MFVLGPTVVERIVDVKGFIPVMKPRSEFDLERPWELEPDREMVKPEMATLRSERLLAVRPLSSSPEMEAALLAAMSCARRVGDRRPALEWVRIWELRSTSAAAQSETHSWISRSRECAMDSASGVRVWVRIAVGLPAGGSLNGSEWRFLSGEGPLDDGSPMATPTSSAL